MSKDRGPDSKECNADLRSNTTQPGPQQPDVIAILTEFDDLAYRGNHGMVVELLLAVIWHSVGFGVCGALAAEPFQLFLRSSFAA
jgi:hypothetical protein